MFIGVLPRSVTQDDDLKEIADGSTAKVHVIAILKCLESEGAWVPDSGAQAVWQRYKSQEHDLFLSNTTKADYFLTDGPNRGLKLLKG